MYQFYGIFCILLLAFLTPSPQPQQHHLIVQCTKVFTKCVQYPLYTTLGAVYCTTLLHPQPSWFTYLSTALLASSVLYCLRWICVTILVLMYDGIQVTLMLSWAAGYFTKSPTLITSRFYLALTCIPVYTFIPLLQLQQPSQFDGSTVFQLCMQCTVHAAVWGTVLCIPILRLLCTSPGVPSFNSPRRSPVVLPLLPHQPPSPSSQSLKGVAPSTRQLQSFDIDGCDDSPASSPNFWLSDL
uniref:Uncharacterized protein n=1 Tax=Lygus hesperus TaxID=30085 RepID=A0A146MAL7_LYGHE